MNNPTLSVVEFRNSSNIQRAVHDGTDLFLQMKGGTYKYFDVPVNTFLELCQAQSVGVFVNTAIKKGGFRFEKAEMADAATVATAKPALIVLGDGSFDYQDGTPANFLTPSGVTIRPAHANSDLPFKVKFINPEVQLAYAKPGDAAFDLVASSVTEPTIIEPGSKLLIMTGIAVKLAPGTAGYVMSRSGLANKFLLAVANAPGLIDSGYIGELGVILENRGEMAYEVMPMDRIAQFMVVPVIIPNWEVVTDLEQTERGSGGFGSTGTEKVSV